MSIDALDTPSSLAPCFVSNGPISTLFLHAKTLKGNNFQPQVEGT